MFPFPHLTNEGVVKKKWRNENGKTKEQKFRIELDLLRLTSFYSDHGLCVSSETLWKNALINITCTCTLSSLSSGLSHSGLNVLLFRLCCFVPFLRCCFCNCEFGDPCGLCDYSELSDLGPFSICIRQLAHADSFAHETQQKMWVI